MALKICLVAIVLNIVFSLLKRATFNLGEELDARWFGKLSVRQWIIYLGIVVTFFTAVISGIIAVITML